MTEDTIALAIIFTSIGFILGWTFCIKCGEAMVERIRQKIEKTPSVGD